MRNSNTALNIAPNWDFVKSFPMKDGLPIAGHIDYDEAYFWIDRDPRFYATIAYNACIWAPFAALLLAISLMISPAEGAESSTRIAVLPFEIHALKPMDHLAEGLQAMITARLAREGFDVMDPAATNKSELSRIPLSDVDLVRKVGRDNNIDWLIGGSLTQIGEKMRRHGLNVEIESTTSAFS